jgi:hypothetical protein
VFRTFRETTEFAEQYEALFGEPFQIKDAADASAVLDVPLDLDDATAADDEAAESNSEHEG